MSKFTQTEALRECLIDRGFKIAERQTTRMYTILKAPSRVSSIMPENFYLGRGSALRYGRTVASSLPVNDSWRCKRIAEGMILLTIWEARHGTDCPTS